MLLTAPKYNKKYNKITTINEYKKYNKINILINFSKSFKKHRVVAKQPPIWIVFVDTA